ncbi:turripeptide Gsg9.2-like [Phymastichus coffea]|uniref:turripeptide Gsg9.2-like n=1 Tax=Phymastichus coffea TaxID=108790 RepID=UPI00273CE066|nr:turripeptide Gsg9.2-like [Phymastichus coffea]
MAKLAVFFTLLMLACHMVLSVNAQPLNDKQSCLCATTDDLNWVCGSDGQSYVNLSTLECEKKCKRRSVEMSHRGKC